MDPAVELVRDTVSKLTLSRPVTPNGVIKFKQWDMGKGVSKFENKVNTNEEQLISDV